MVPVRRPPALTPHGVRHSPASCAGAAPSHQNPRHICSGGPPTIGRWGSDGDGDGDGEAGASQTRSRDRYASGGHAQGADNCRLIDGQTLPGNPNCSSPISRGLSEQPCPVTRRPASPANRFPAPGTSYTDDFVPTPATSPY